MNLLSKCTMPPLLLNNDYTKLMGFTNNTVVKNKLTTYNGLPQRMFDIINQAWPDVMQYVSFMSIVEQDINKLSALQTSYPEITALPLDSGFPEYFIENYTVLAAGDTKLQTMINQYMIYYDNLRVQIETGLINLQSYWDSIYIFIYNYYANLYFTSWPTGKTNNGDPNPDYVEISNNIQSSALTVSAAINTNPYGGFDYTGINTMLANVTYQLNLIRTYENAKYSPAVADAVNNIWNDIKDPLGDFNSCHYVDNAITENDFAIMKQNGISNLPYPVLINDFRLSGLINKFETLTTSIQSMMAPGLRSGDYTGVNITQLMTWYTQAISVYTTLTAKVQVYYNLVTIKAGTDTITMWQKKRFFNMLAKNIGGTL